MMPCFSLKYLGVCSRQMTNIPEVEFSEFSVYIESRVT